MKLLAAKSVKPRPIRMRASTYFISRGISGIITSCGMPVQASTSPICSAL